ncbi:phage/plasmid replication domain-containing protein [Bacteroides clarus]|uniref:Replication-associated protein G2P N-terminal domain-containing protein n=1 Tax=Bacteroides clarus TaxID=626929 RepID=A0A1Y3Z4I2_9BACE|nr:phage/plasmid replication protein [Bacteroides clarus]OUO02618.1 hypothetical protein B5F97_03685 [Bacteroides clarus]
MKSQYEKKRLITFDRIKIKSNYKYLLDTKVKFNEMFHSRSGEKTGLFYSSKDDINIPYNLYIAVSYVKQTLTLEFSSKILKENYPDLISRDTIKKCLTNINQLNICNIDVDSILSNGVVTSVDITYDADLILNDNLLDALNSQVNNYRRFKWTHYNNEGITFTKDVKSKDCTETITLYNKEKEICTSHNKNFLNSLSQPQQIMDYFKGKTRFEITLDTPKKIMNYLNLTDTKIFSVLNSDTNPILILFDKIFNNSVTNISNATFDNYEEWSMKIILDSYNGDLKRLEQDVRNKFCSRSGATKRMKKFEAVHHAMTSASTNENLIEKVRNLLL